MIGKQYIASNLCVALYSSVNVYNIVEYAVYLLPVRFVILDLFYSIVVLSVRGKPVCQYIFLE